MIPVTMTVVVRETELDTETFHRDPYMSFVSDETRLQNMGHSSDAFSITNEPISFELMLQLDNNWRLESEQQRVSATNGNNTRDPNVSVTVWRSRSVLRSTFGDSRSLRGDSVGI